MQSIPPEINRLKRDRGRASPALIGEIVHELLRDGNFASEQRDLDERIRAIAWRRQLTDETALREVKQKAQAWLSQYQQSDVCRWLESARRAGRPLYTELPFIYRSEKRVIHGVMDVLLQGPAGAWCVIDYKTSKVVRASLAQHARRYQLQLGLYAAAAQMQLELERLPQPYVHYIRHNETIALDRAACRAELEDLESTIGELLPDA